eukprot:g7574.t1
MKTFVFAWQRQLKARLGLDSTTLLTALGVSNTGSAQSRTKIFQEFQHMPKAGELKEEVLRKIKLGIEPINLIELEPPKGKTLRGEENRTTPKLTISYFLLALSTLISLYSVFHTIHSGDMWEHYG